MKCNVNRTSMGMLGPTGIGGVLRNFEGEILLIFSMNVGVKESNEA